MESITVKLIFQIPAATTTNNTNYQKCVIVQLAVHVMIHVVTTITSTPTPIPTPIRCVRISVATTKSTSTVHTTAIAGATIEIAAVIPAGSPDVFCKK